MGVPGRGSCGGWASDTPLSPSAPQYLAAWRARSPGERFVHFVHVDRWSPYGRWGAKEFATQPRSQAPKFDALMTYYTNASLLVA